MEFISFQLKGRVGHFLRAEAGASALSYPFPPRTTIIGLIGAVLGLGKDEPQVKLEPACIAVSGKLPRTFWHRIKLRKEDPEYLSRMIRKTQKESETGKDYKATLILQEWLFEPAYTIWASLPEPYHGELAERLQHRRWHFQPSLGLSEMMADLVFSGKSEAVALLEAVHHVQTVFPKNCGQLDMETVFDKKLSVNAMRMPRTVTPDRVFTLSDYYMERDARPVPIRTGQALRCNDRVIVCL